MHRLTRRAARSLALTVFLLSVLPAHVLAVKVNCRPSSDGNDVCGTLIYDGEGRERAIFDVIDFDSLLSDDLAAEVDPAYRLSDDSHYEILTITILNTGKTPLTVDPAQIVAVDTYEGFLFPGGEVPPAAFPLRRALPLTDVKPGEQIEGAVFFLIDQGFIAWRIYYRPTPDRFIPVAAIAAGGGGAGTRPVNIISQ